MDQATAHILTKLDLIIDRQRDHGALLAGLAAAAGATTKKPRRLFSRIASLPPFWQNLAAGGLIWTFGLSVKAYLDHGGKPLEIIELLLKYAL